jgi:hypothetical protein
LIGFIHVIFTAIFDLIYDLHSFLSQLGRIASRSYEPSDDDVIRARLRTLGVQEHKLKIDGGTEFVGLLYFLKLLPFLSLKREDTHKRFAFFVVEQVSRVLLVKLGATGISMMLVGLGRW